MLIFVEMEWLKLTLAMMETQYQVTVARISAKYNLILPVRKMVVIFQVATTREMSQFQS